MDKSLEEQLAFIKQNTSRTQAETANTSQAAGAVANGVRNDVTNVTNAASTPTALPAHLQTFENIVKEDDEGLGLANDFYIMTMVNELLRASATDDQVISAMGFDRKNLLQLRQAIFSIAQEKVVTQKMINDYIRHGKSHVDVFYRNMLGLDESSTEEDIKLRVTAFSGQLDQLHELFEYDPAGKVMSALKDCSETQDIPTKLAIVKAHGFTGKSSRFHESDIQAIIDANKTK